MIETNDKRENTIGGRRILMKGHIVAAVMDSSDREPHLIHGFLGPREPAPNGISIGSAAVPNTHTETTLCVTSVAIDRICAIHA